jgi:hypothetical protein
MATCIGMLGTFGAHALRSRFSLANKHGDLSMGKNKEKGHFINLIMSPCLEDSMGYVLFFRRCPKPLVH